MSCQKKEPRSWRTLCATPLMSRNQRSQTPLQRFRSSCCVGTPRQGHCWRCRLASTNGSRKPSAIPGSDCRRRVRGGRQCPCWRMPLSLGRGPCWQPWVRSGPNTRSAPSHACLSTPPGRTTSRWRMPARASRSLPSTTSCPRPPAPAAAGHGRSSAADGRRRIVEPCTALRRGPQEAPARTSSPRPNQRRVRARRRPPRPSSISLNIRSVCDRSRILLTA